MLSIPANFLLIPEIGISSLATVTSAGAWVNFLALFVILYARGHFRMPGWLGQPRRSAADRGAGHGRRPVRRARRPRRWYFGGFLERAIALAVLVGVGGLVYFGVAFLIGGVDRERSHP